MFGCTYVTQMYLNPSPLNSVLIILEGFAVYFLILLVEKDAFLFELFDKLKSKIKSKKVRKS